MPDKYDVPLMYRSQIEGRCQLQRILKKEELIKVANEDKIAPKQYAERWTDEWLKVHEDQVIPKNSISSSENGPKEYEISWRFVRNGGQDKAMIRPTIGAFGLPFYPGSSMKGAFRQGCTTQEQRDLYCGKELEDGKFQPGILRFHGGYPVNENWKQNLVDIVHPQQGWQVKVKNATTKPERESAYALISLYKPKINFGISSQLSETNWEEVWQIWEKALGAGIGCRVSSGYGQTNKITGDVLYEVKLQGQGAASKLLDNGSEFRPNIFRAALRGHALRIFGGLNQALAEDIVDELFGGIRSGKEKVGLLGMAFVPDSPKWRSADPKDPEEAYDVTGKLIWRLSGKLKESEDRDSLAELVKKLTQFAMLLGGFGKSWRRADHRIFYPTYTKHLIGCHWEWMKDSDNEVRDLKDVDKLINQVQEAAKQWMNKRGFEVKQLPASQPTPTPAPAPVQNDSRNQNLKRPVPRSVIQQAKPAETEVWREAWRKDNVQVWGRIAENSLKSLVIPWLHSSERQAQQRGNHHHNQNRKPVNQSNVLALQKPDKPSNQNARPVIYRTSVTGRVKDKSKSNEPTQIGRLWHRMYPVGNLIKDVHNASKTKGKPVPCLELLTIFPDGSDEFNNFLKFLKSEPGGFKRLWPQ